jgi:hypothetical protein
MIPHFWNPSPGFQIASNSRKTGAIKAVVSSVGNGSVVVSIRLSS